MTCEDAKKALPLLLYGEMEFEEEDRLQEHLDGCEPCRLELSRERTLHSALDDRELEVSPFLLRRCRQQLEQSITSESRGRNHWFSFLSEAFSGASWMPRIAKPTGAVALLAVGFFAAQLTPVMRRAGGFGSAGMVDPNSARVRYVEPGEDGKVQIVVDETRERVISGGLDDEAIRRLLISAAKDPNDPGLRVESVEILKSRSEADDIRSALLSSLQRDSNPGVRLKALEALKPYAGHPEVKKALEQALLADDNPGVRTQAIDLLTQNAHGDQDIGMLQELLHKEQNGYVRNRCTRALRDMKASTETY